MFRKRIYKIDANLLHLFEALYVQHFAVPSGAAASEIFVLILDSRQPLNFQFLHPNL